MKTIGIKLADGSFYPVLQENIASEKKLELTTAHNNQTKVMVDLYRSAECSMDDAEYVDSLQIENLVAHPNGEPAISFTVTIDENNELSAKIVDSETGNQSKTTITLVSRTQEERLITDEYDIKDSNDKKDSTAKKIVAGGGLLAAAAALREKEDRTEVEFTPAADMEIEDKVTEEESFDLDLPDFPETTEESEPVFDETQVDITEPVEDTPEEPLADDFVMEDTPVVEDFPAMEDTPIIEDTPVIEDSPVIDDTPVFEDSPAIEETPLTEHLDDFDLDIPVAEDTPEEVPAEIEIPAEDTAFEMDIPEETAEETIEEPKFEITENETEVTIPSDDVIADESEDFSLDLPDFPEDTSDSIPEDDPFALPEDKLAETVKDFPSFEEETAPVESEPVVEETAADSFNMDDMDDFSTDTISDTNFDDTFDIPDVPTEEEVSMNDNDFPDDFFEAEESKSFNDDAPAGKGLSFTGLYDKETELGTSSYEEDDTKRKTKAPVIICIICAIICVIATALILFIIPSKYNLLKKADKPATKVEAPVEKVVEPVVEETPEPEPIPEPEPVPEAKEEEIVIIEKAEEVVPEQPPVAEEKPKDITYKIKWGDTLWDIAETYYKNPWRYKYIARFNKIKNPDYIISGTYITIPAE